MSAAANSAKAAVIAVVFGVVSAAFLAVPLWFFLGFFFILLGGHVNRAQIYVAAPCGVIFGAWVGSMAFEYFRKGLAHEDERTRPV
ncbi:MAG: hypothetical protein LAN37_12490 [Acidobacteriia bacterium]|nr:hypothetical protein [Terriglobia bacterium]